MPPVIIADASCLILLEKIDAVELLRQLFGRITVTDTVAAEYGLLLPEWVEVQAAQDTRQLPRQWLGQRHCQCLKSLWRSAPNGGQRWRPNGDQSYLSASISR